MSLMLEAHEPPLQSLTHVQIYDMVVPFLELDRCPRLMDKVQLTKSLALQFQGIDCKLYADLQYAYLHTGHDLLKS